MTNATYSRVMFVSPGQAELQSAETKALPDGPTDVVIKTEYSIVSPGTELACLSGGESWAPLPFAPGYGSVGRIVRAGAEVEDLAVGQRVFTYGDHAAYSPTKVVAMPLTDAVDPVRATFARMAAVSITSLRVADVALGDTVAVFGLGLVGNLAAQLFALSGCEVIGIDPSPKRRELAEKCGISHVLPPGADLPVIVKSLTGGRMARCVVEATGVPAVAENAAALAGKNGELILLGSPRGAHASDLTGFLNYAHLWDRGCVTIKGAHEWRFPVREDAWGYGRHSFESNVRSILRFIENGKLLVEPLISHVVSPEECQTVYDGLKNQKDLYLGVVFDWSKI